MSGTEHTSERAHLSTCPLCEAACGIVVITRGDTVTDIRGDADDPASRGHICPKAVALKDLHEDPDRLKHPVKRVGKEWVRISWREAMQLTVNGIRDVQQRYGADSLGLYLGNPTVHSLGALLTISAFSKALGTRNRYSATSVDQLPHHLAALRMFGHPLLIPIPDIDHTDCWIMFGANPAVSNGSLMTAPDVLKRLKAIRAHGGEVIVVDPRRNESADVATAHHFIKPGTDALVLLAMTQVLFAERLVAPGRVAAYTDGLAELEAVAAPFTPERVSAASGMAADVIRELARKLATNKRAVLYGRIGISTQEFGGLCCWLINALNILTGHLDEPGGAMFTAPAVEVMRSGGMYSAARSARWRSRVRQLPEFGGELPVAALAEEMDTPGAGQIRALLTHAGNPVLSTPNGARLEKALPGLEFYAAIDFYVNETTKHAHVILPPTAGLERAHYDLIFHALAIRNTAKWSPAVLAPAPDTRADWEILNELTWRLSSGGLRKRARVWGRSQVVRMLGLRGMMKRALKGNRYGARASFETLERSPHGVDLGALIPMLPERLATKDKRIVLAPAEFCADVARLEQALAHLDAARATPAGELQLISRRDLRSNNSWMANSERLVRGKRRCALLMHPTDAHTHGLGEGGRATLTSRAGEVEVEVEVTDAIMPGVVCLPHGWGHNREGVQLRVARANGGVSVNDVTDDQRIDVLSGNAALSGTTVLVRRV